jgi:hypothetical protein
MKVIRYILWFLLALAQLIEYIYSIFQAIVETVGLKINEGVDYIEVIYKTLKEKHQKAKN